ncbi:DUF368 domain-containing protein [Halonatronum saccharophilum]|uniref:DUF368 domain-containing protein n=1 Tax=Halonatronum saccharophilum TaxID=150060 RepID=UPI00048139E7|nr:DUF368 domain-containing protein [Halonatronum saccharophilum]
MKGFWEYLIKGIPIGMANTLPGVSGGTVALILRIYERLINSIKNLNLRMLIPIGIGAVIGVGVSSKLIIGLLESNLRGFMLALLLGLIFASSKITADQVENFNFKSIFLAIVGLIFTYFYSIDIDTVVLTSDISLARFFFGGTIGSIAMILPGVSGGTLLIMLGLYQGVLEAISTLNIIVLLVFGFGVGVGLLIFSWTLSYLLNRYNSPVMAFLTGLILGSMRSVLPDSLGLLEIIGFVLGGFIIWRLDKNRILGEI